MTHWGGREGASVALCSAVTPGPVLAALAGGGTSIRAERPGNLLETRQAQRDGTFRRPPGTVPFSETVQRAAAGLPCFTRAARRSGAERRAAPVGGRQEAQERDARDLHVPRARLGLVGLRGPGGRPPPLRARHRGRAAHARDVARPAGEPPRSPRPRGQRLRRSAASLSPCPARLMRTRARGCRCCWRTSTGWRSGP